MIQFNICKPDQILKLFSLLYHIKLIRHVTPELQSSDTGLSTVLVYLYHKQHRNTMSAILSADDLNDFISPGVACVKPVETLPLQKPEHHSVSIHFFTGHKQG